MRYEQLPQAEPAALIGGIASVLGTLALTAADVDAVQSVGTALGIAGTQAVLTRQTVYSPKTAQELRSSATPTADLAGLLAGSTGRRREPALAVGLMTLLGGFLVQFFAGVDMIEALVAAAGISGSQGIATRAHVYSPASAREIATTNVIATQATAADLQDVALPALQSGAT